MTKERTKIYLRSNLKKTRHLHQNTARFNYDSAVRILLLTTVLLPVPTLIKPQIEMLLFAPQAKTANNSLCPPPNSAHKTLFPPLFLQHYEPLPTKAGKPVEPCG
jgi:hypothetical protein